MPNVSTHRWTMAFGRLSVGIVFLAVTLPLFFVSQAFCFERPKDFRGIKWGTEVSKIKGLVPKPALNESDKKAYERPSDSLEIAGGNVAGITYFFANDRLTQVWISIKGYRQFLDMKSLFFTLYGPPDQAKEKKSSPELGSDYSWYAGTDDEANVNLYHIAFRDGVFGAKMEWRGALKGKSGL